ncbi:MAG: sigma-70 family RNA polymerase sigma factor [Chloroflexi bacterium]|nr:sigma-70 family RNA polymerase sigma factor [Chloroflexota bacterium]
MAWKELVDRYARLVYSIALRYDMSSTDADDVFQDVFTIVYRRLSTLRDQKLLAAWLIQITHHECQHLRRKNPDHAELPETLVDGKTAPQDEVEILERRFLVRRAINQLEAPYRDLLTALFLETPTPSYEELAHRLKIPIGSIGPTRARSFKKLQVLLGQMGLDFAA